MALSVAGEIARRKAVCKRGLHPDEFFDKCFDDYIARHPQAASQLGLKTDYDKWDDNSDAQVAADLAAQLTNLATLKRDFDFDALDAQTQLSWKLFENDAQRDAEGFRFRFDSYPVNQMFGWHSGTPTFPDQHSQDRQREGRGGVHRADQWRSEVVRSTDRQSANARGRRRDLPPKFVFPLVLDASRKVIKGQPFDASGPNSPLLDDFSKKVSSSEGCRCSRRAIDW